MSVFAIDSNDKIIILASADEAQSGIVDRFQSARQFQTLTQGWSGSRLVGIWNQLPGRKPVNTFTDRKTAVARIWNAIQTLDSAACSSKSDDMKSLRAQAGTLRERSTKTARIIALLEQPAGCSLQSLMRATGWQAHSVRGFLSGQLRKKLGLRVKSFQRDGERVYALRS
jgi:Protein of unknown function (DUF3489)